MLTLNFTPMSIRPKPNMDREAQFHCALKDSTNGAYFTADTKALAQAGARQLLSIRVHALSEKDAKAHKATYQGIPAHYRLARGAQ